MQDFKKGIEEVKKGVEDFKKGIMADAAREGGLKF